MELFFNLITPSNIDDKIKLVQLYGWLLTGIVTAVLVAGYNTWMDLKKDKIYHKNLALMVGTELSLIHFLLSSCIAKNDLNEIIGVNISSSRTWDKIKADVARFLPAHYFRTVDSLYLRISHLEITPNSFSLDEIRKLEELTRLCLSHLEKITDKKITTYKKNCDDCKCNEN